LSCRPAAGAQARRGQSRFRRAALRAFRGQLRRALAAAPRPRPRRRRAAAEARPSCQHPSSGAATLGNHSVPGSLQQRANRGCTMANYKIAILVGSLRKDSINRKVARSMCALRGDNLDCSMIEIGDLPLYNQDHDADPPEQYVRFRRQIAEADGVLFVSPEYNRGIPGVLKNAIDVGSRPYGQSVFDKKPGAIVTASPGAMSGCGGHSKLRHAPVRPDY